jgi:hypothetical protein
VGAALATSNLGRLEARAGNVGRGRQLLEEALGSFREIRSPMFIAETQVRLDECLVLEGDFTAAIASSRELLDGFRGRPGFEQVELTTLRLLGTAGGFAQLAGGSGGDLAACTQALDEAIERATDLEAPYELALALAVRSVLDPLIDGAQPPRYEDTHERAAADHQRAEAIFDSLGVTRAVVTWSSPISGELILRGRAMLGEWSGES